MLFGMVTRSSMEQPAKADSLISATPSGIVIGRCTARAASGSARLACGTRLWSGAERPISGSIVSTESSGWSDTSACMTKRALLSEEIDEGTKLKYEMLQYEIV